MGYADLLFDRDKDTGGLSKRKDKPKDKKDRGYRATTGILDITMYRDDIFKLNSPEVKKTEIPFDVKQYDHCPC
jgi:pyrimidine operon attenuation protein/uracil phosphoribosyltransferase